MSRQRTIFRQVQAYLDYRRALGYDLRVVERLLRQFAKFVDQSGWRGPLTTDLILRWVLQPKAAKHEIQSQPTVGCPRPGPLLGGSRRPNGGARSAADAKSLSFRPHIFGEREAVQLLSAARSLKPTYRLRPLTYGTLFGLLASTGLRVGEALRLTLGQVDLKRGILRIEQTKFKKTRLVPLHPTATRALRRYAAARGRLWGQDENKPFFVGSSGAVLSHWAALDAFHTLCVDLGWQQGNGERPRPHIHDLRHSFACQRLLRAGIVLAKTFIIESRRSRPTWGTPALPTPIGI